MNEPLRTAIDLCQSRGIDFNEMLANCLACGEVQSNARFFCIGYPQGRTFWVTMLAGDFGECARFNADRFDTISYVREFKGSSRVRGIPIHQLARHGKRIHTAAAAE